MLWTLAMVIGAILLGGFCYIVFYYIVQQAWSITLPLASMSPKGIETMNFLGAFWGSVMALVFVACLVYLWTRVQRAKEEGYGYVD